MRKNSLSHYKYSSLRYWFYKKKVCVIGLGKSGVAAAQILSCLEAKVFLTDRRPKKFFSAWIKKIPQNIKVELGSHRFLNRSWDLIIVSPGVPESVWKPFVEKGIPVWGELELGYRILSLSDRWPVCSIGITGTNGKTTTAALLGDIFKRSGRQTVVAGNIGNPLCSILDQINKKTALILEISSYQLESAYQFRATLGAVLNITPDHLGRHKTMSRYAQTKMKLFQNDKRKNFVVLNYNDFWCRKLSAQLNGQKIWFNEKSGSSYVTEAPLMRRRLSQRKWPSPRFIRGRHNRENSLVAIACSKIMGISTQSILKSLSEFPGVRHRLQFVKTKNRVHFYNDSKSTNVESTRVALQSFESGVHLILGGEDKGLSYKSLIPSLRKRVERIYLIGDAASKIKKELRGVSSFVDCGNLKNAVDVSFKNSKHDDIVLLSPACASFDQFANFEQRGDVFEKYVSKI